MWSVLALQCNERFYKRWGFYCIRLWEHCVAEVLISTGSAGTRICADGRWRRDLHINTNLDRGL